MVSVKLLIQKGKKVKIPGSNLEKDIIMIEKIISGGQTGVDQAALDVALELDIPHGGWIEKGRKTENGILPERYKLKEMPASGYYKPAEQTVLDSDGILIISHGKLKSGSALILKLAKKHQRPWLHIDLNGMNAFEAAKTVNAWIVQHNIKILNVAGTQASKDPDIYKATKIILRAVIALGIIKTDMPDSSQSVHQLPRTVEEAVDQLMSELPLKGKTKIAGRKEEDLVYLHLSLGEYIRSEFELRSGNKELMESCCSFSGKREIHEDEASELIIKEFWKKLQETHILRVVK